MTELKDVLLKMQEAIELLQKVGRQQLRLEDEPLKVEKVAVRVNNEREFKILMKHYNELGWIAFSSATPKEIVDFNKTTPLLTWTYHDRFFAIRSLSDSVDYKIIDFDFFCAQKGIANPKPILTTEDGVDIYDKSRLIFTVKNHCDGWYHNGCNHANTTLANKPEYFKFFYSKEAADKWLERHNRSFITNDGVKVSYDEEYYAVEKDHKITRYILCSTPNGIAQFSTRMLAEQWIEEQNKPKETEIKLYNNSGALISKDEITIMQEDVVVRIKPSDLEDISYAYYSL